jgi:uncharacterized membrane protein YkoI
MNQRAVRVLLAVMALQGLLVSHPVSRAVEPGTVELEDVSEAEKLKWARAATVSVIEAIKTATDHTPGQVIEAALHAVGGRLLYEIEVVTKEERVVELFVDPQTGKLIPQEEIKR